MMLTPKRFRPFNASWHRLKLMCARGNENSSLSHKTHVSSATQLSSPSPPGKEVGAAIWYLPLAGVASFRQSSALTSGCALSNPSQLASNNITKLSLFKVKNSYHGVQYAAVVCGGATTPGIVGHDGGDILRKGRLLGLQPLIHHLHPPPRHPLGLLETWQDCITAQLYQS